MSLSHLPARPPLAARELPLEEIRAGSGVAFRCRVTAAEVDAFAQLTGDSSPIHMSAEAARTFGFDGRISHGMLMASWCSTVVGMFLPGRNGVLTSCAVDFLEPLEIPAEVLVSATVRQVSRAARSLRIAVLVTNRGVAVCKATVGAGVRKAV